VGGKQFSIAYGMTNTVKASVSGACLTLLGKANRHVLRAKLVASQSTVQPTMSMVVTLIRR
jgi:hypothetical protein